MPPLPTRARSISPLRVVTVTGGAVVGGIIGAAVMGGWSLVVGGPRALWLVSFSPPCACG